MQLPPLRTEAMDGAIRVTSEFLFVDVQLQDSMQLS